MKGVEAGQTLGLLLARRVEAVRTLGLQAGKSYYERGRGRAGSRVTAGKAGRGRADSRVTGREALL